MGFLHVIPCTLIGNLSKLWMTIYTLKFPRPYSISPLLQSFLPLSQTFPQLSQTFPPLLQTFPPLCRHFPHCRRHSHCCGHIHFFFFFFINLSSGLPPVFQTKYKFLWKQHTYIIYNLASGITVQMLSANSTYIVCQYLS